MKRHIQINCANRDQHQIQRKTNKKKTNKFQMENGCFPSKWEFDGGVPTLSMILLLLFFSFKIYSQFKVDKEKESEMFYRFSIYVLLRDSIILFHSLFNHHFFAAFPYFSLRFLVILLFLLAGEFFISARALYLLNFFQRKFFKLFGTHILIRANSSMLIEIKSKETKQNETETV